MADISKVKLGTIIYHIKDSVARKIMKGAGEKEAGEAGQVPAPAAGAANRYLRSDGTWQVPTASIITQDNAHRFVTDEEKTNWNGKVNTGDIVNNCTSTATNKPLSAAQGKALWEKYTQLNGDIGDIKYTGFSKDLNITANSSVIEFMKYNSDTLHSPLKEGVTVSGDGLVISYANSTYGVQICAAQSNDTLLVRQKRDTTWREWKELVNHDHMRWNKLGAVDLTDEIQYLPYDKNKVHEILVSYGTKNSVQSYGGGTVVLAVDEIKPCYLPCYEQDTIIGIAYIYNHSGKIEVRSHFATNPLRVIAWVR